MKQTEKIYVLLTKLIADGKAAIERRGHGPSGTLLQPEDVRKWTSELTLFTALAGDLVKPWAKNLQHDGKVCVASSVELPLAALEAIKYGIDQGLLTTYRNLILAEAFGDLHEQGKYLLEEGYLLAAGVLFRAVLEEKLRQLCASHNCATKKARPTIADLNAALYGAQVYDKTVMLNVTALAAVGNDAAHNKPLRREDVERLMNGVSDLLARFST